MFRSTFTAKGHRILSRNINLLTRACMGALVDSPMKGAVELRIPGPTPSCTNHQFCWTPLNQHSTRLHIEREGGRWNNTTPGAKTRIHPAWSAPLQPCGNELAHKGHTRKIPPFKISLFYSLAHVRYSGISTAPANSTGTPRRGCSQVPRTECAVYSISLGTPGSSLDSKFGQLANRAGNNSSEPIEHVVSYLKC